MKKAIVVGATSGIGRELSKLLVSKGYQTGITGRRSDLLLEIQKESPGQYFIKAFDITITEIIPQKLEELVQELGGLDLIVICSGTGHENKTLDFAIEKQTIGTNVSGFTALADWAYNYFEKKKTGQLVAITSIAGLRGGRQAPSYNATKAYEINYLEGLRQKAGKEKQQITITDIRPGFVDTEMAKGEGLFWVAPVAKAANQILRAIEQKRKIAYVTKRWVIIACLLKSLPNWIYNKI